MAKMITEELKKLWIKLLKAEAKRKTRKAAKLEARIIKLELELKESGSY